MSFNSILLHEAVQLGWFQGKVPPRELGIALRAHPAVEWYMRHKCPELTEWLDSVLIQTEMLDCTPELVRQAEEMVLQKINDCLTYALDPAAYDAQPFPCWDSSELTDLVDFGGKTVIDVGAGTGRLSLVAAEEARVVYAVEPVANLRRYLNDKARRQGFKNVFPLDGLIVYIPFEDGFADVTMGGHVFGDHPMQEYREMRRITTAGGIVILCRGNGDADNEIHHFLASAGFAWERFEEPGAGAKRKYWKQRWQVGVIGPVQRQRRANPWREPVGADESELMFISIAYTCRRKVPASSGCLATSSATSYSDCRRASPSMTASTLVCSSVTLSLSHRQMAKPSGTSTSCPRMTRSGSAAVA